MANIDYSLKGRIRGAEPPKAPGIELEVVRITSTDNRIFYLLSDCPWAAYYHWKGLSVACAGGSDCTNCEKAVPRKWRSYIHALEQVGTSQREVIIEITHSATVMIDVQLCGQPHRGAVVQMKKTKGGKHGRFVIEVLPRRISPAQLADEKDPAPVLTRLWEMNARKLENKR